MDIQSASQLQAAEIGQQIDTAVAKKTLDAANQQGEAVLSLLADAADVGRQAASTAQVDGKGFRVDVTG